MNTHRVLVVEDDPDLAATMQEALQDEGYEVRVVLHGVQAYAEAAAFLPHVILLDLMMPDFDGYDIGRQLRGDDVTAAIPVVIVSGYKQLEDAEILLKTQYSLFKPFDISDLLGCVEAAIARRPYPQR
jgi:DNA-binding response OmpR family regulator